jgi:hypothetical protein
MLFAGQVAILLGLTAEVHSTHLTAKNHRLDNLLVALGGQVSLVFGGTPAPMVAGDAEELVRMGGLMVSLGLEVVGQSLLVESLVGARLTVESLAFLLLGQTIEETPLPDAMVVGLRDSLEPLPAITLAIGREAVATDAVGSDVRHRGLDFPAIEALTAVRADTVGHTADHIVHHSRHQHDATTQLTLGVNALVGLLRGQAIQHLIQGEGHQGVLVVHYTPAILFCRFLCVNPSPPRQGRHPFC